MKAKTIIMSAGILLAAAGVTFGQLADDPNTAQARRKVWHTRDPQVEKSAVSGNLAFVKGRIALQSGDATYYLSGIDRLIGFVDGLKEGENVALEGYAFAIPHNDQNTAVEYAFHVVKLIFNGKEYDLDNEARFSQAPPRPPLPGYTSPHRNMPRRSRGFQPFGQFERFHDFRDFHNNERRGNW
ncbi:MAG: hypothetical protein LBF60_02945 [Treponema sp.]|nr:hypothetical protein [Treponema sp.]